MFFAFVIILYCLLSIPPAAQRLTKDVFAGSRLQPPLSPLPLPSNLILTVCLFLCRHNKTASVIKEQHKQLQELEKKYAKRLNNLLKIKGFVTQSVLWKESNI